MGDREVDQQLVLRAQRGDKRAFELLVLKYTEGWSYVEIADHLGVTATAIEARLHRARGRMRAELAALGPSPTEPQLETLAAKYPLAQLTPGLWVRLADMRTTDKRPQQAADQWPWPLRLFSN